MDVFVSVGTGLNSDQERFVPAVENRIRTLGLTPKTIGRNTFSSDTPLRAVKDLMAECAGTVVIALERFQFPNGLERAGTDQQRELVDVRLPTPWNQIEAAMAYMRELPLLVLVDENVRSDGLLEKGNDWFVQQLDPTPAALDTDAFTGILASWHGRLVSPNPTETPRDVSTSVDPGSMTIGQLLLALKPGQAWALLGALVAVAGVAFSLGAAVLN